MSARDQNWKLSLKSILLFALFAVNENSMSNSKCNTFTLPLYKKTINGTNYFNFVVSVVCAAVHLIRLTRKSFALQFFMFVPEQEKQEEGLYNLYFHACPNYQRDLFPLNFQVSVRVPTTIETVVNICFPSG